MSLLSVSRSLSEQQPHLSHAPRQSQHSTVAKSAIMSGATFANGDTCQPTKVQIGPKDLLQPPPKSIAGRLLEADGRKSADRGGVTASQRGGVGSALTDTPLSTAPSSPRMYVVMSLLVISCHWINARGVSTVAKCELHQKLA